MCFARTSRALTQDGLLQLRHLLPEIIDVVTECLDLAEQQVQRPGWLFIQWRSRSAFAITDRVSIGVR